MPWILSILLLLTGCASIKEANLAAKKEKFELDIENRTDKNTGEVVIKSVKVVEVNSVPIEKKETSYKVSARFGPEKLRIVGDNYKKQIGYEKIAYAEIVSPRILKGLVFYLFIPSIMSVTDTDNRTFVILSINSENEEPEDLYLAIASSTVPIFEELFKRSNVKVKTRSRQDQ